MVSGPPASASRSHCLQASPEAARDAEAAISACLDKVRLGKLQKVAQRFQDEPTCHRTYPGHSLRPGNGPGGHRTAAMDAWHAVYTQLILCAGVCLGGLLPSQARVSLQVPGSVLDAAQAFRVKRAEAAAAENRV
jgi:hypothetical protein